MRPVVRGLVRKGVPLPQLVDELKQLYVQVAADEVSREGKLTQSAISVMTGVHRKDVKRLLEQGEEMDRPPVHASLGSRMAGLWMGADVFTDDEGAPLALHEHRSQGSPSFEDLVAAVSTDIRSRAVLDEWLRLSVVRWTDDNRIIMNENAFVVDEGEAEMMHFFGRNLRDHIAAGLHNMEGASPSFIDRAVFYPDLSAVSVEEMRKLASELGAKAVGEANRQALARVTEDRAAGNGGHRMTFGVYFYAEPDTVSSPHVSQDEE
jgi:hypothetical protein